MSAVGTRLAYVTLVVSDVEGAAAMWQRDFGLARTDCRVGESGRTLPLLTVGATALALCPPADPFAGGVTATGVHHLALAVDDPLAAADLARRAGVGAAAGLEPGLGGARRLPLDAAATAGVVTYLSQPLALPPAAAARVERVDHLGVASRDNGQAVEVFVNRLGCRLEGTEIDSEVHVALEQFVSDRYGTVVHTRPARLVAALHAAFVTVGDCELELLQELDAGLTTRVARHAPGDTRQDQGAIGRFIATRGPGLHHVALKVPDIDAALAALAEAGHALIDRVGRPGGRAASIGFLHPKSTYGVLVHLVERRETATSRDR